MKDYKIKIKLILKTNVLQSGKNKKELENKINTVIINSIKSDKVLSSLFFDEYQPKIKLIFRKINNKSNYSTKNK